MTAATLTSVAGPIIAVIGVITAAVIAARTADRRQSRQLAAERDRLADGHAAERERLMLRLAHERSVEHLGDVRVVLDRASGELRRIEELVESLRAGEVPGADRVADRKRAVEDVAARLRIRVGATDGMVIALAEVADALGALDKSVRRPAAPTAEALRSAAIDLGVALQDFGEAAVERVGVRTAFDSLAHDEHAGYEGPKDTASARAADGSRRGRRRPLLVGATRRGRRG